MPQMQHIPAIIVYKAILLPMGRPGEGLQMGGDAGKHIPDADGEVDVVLEDKRAGEIFVDDLAPGVGVGAPAPEFGGRGGLWRWFVEVVGKGFVGNSTSINLDLLMLGFDQELQVDGRRSI